MEYTINKLAKLSGVSTRTLRFYEELGLLSPVRKSGNGYRIYGQKEINQLQQILFYREMNIPLEDIGKILTAKDFDSQKALENHLDALYARRSQLDLLIQNVTKTIQAMKGDLQMSDQEKFEGFKKKLIQENESKYGEEIRSKYGNSTVEKSNASLMGMTEERYRELETLTQELHATLREAVAQGDPASELSQKACELHKKWLSFSWDSYSKEAHIGLTQMYVDDPRFTEYYDKIAAGSAAFLRDAVAIYCR